MKESGFLFQRKHTTTCNIVLAVQKKSSNKTNWSRCRSDRGEVCVLW